MNNKLLKHGKTTAKKIEDLKVESIWSYNEPCNKNPGDTDHGCGGIQVSEMGMQDSDKAYYTKTYSTGGDKKGLTKNQTLKKYSKGLKKFKDEDSSDEELDGDELRDKDIENLKDKDMDEVFK